MHCIRALITVHIIAGVGLARPLSMPRARGLFQRRADCRAAARPCPAHAAALGCAVGALSTRAAGGTASCPDLASALALAQTATVRSVSAGMLSC